MAGAAFGAHSATTSVMNFCVPRSMPLAQTMTGVPAAINGARDVETVRTACAGTTKRIAGARGGFGEVRGQRDAVVDPHAGQERALAVRRELSPQSAHRAPRA